MVQGPKRRASYMRISVGHFLGINSRLHRQSPAKSHRTAAGLPNVIKASSFYAPESIQTWLVRDAIPTPALQVWHKRRPDENRFYVEHCSHVPACNSSDASYSSVPASRNT